MSHPLSHDVLSNMCLVIDKEGRILVQMRDKKDWPGLTLPGGHVEKNEKIEESVRREMKEETGLILHDLELCGIFEWDFEGVDHYIAFIYRCFDYEGELKSSEEGRVFFIKKEDMKNYPLSMDMEDIMKIALKGL